MSGKIRIQKRPVLPTERERTFLADSIWLERIRAGPSAFNPYEPKATESPRVATEVLERFLLIVCHFLYLTFFGKSMIVYFPPPGLADPPLAEKISPLYIQTLTPIVP